MPTPEYQFRSSWHLLSTINWKKSEHLLDVGCGDGRTTASSRKCFRKGKVTGIDPSQAMLSWATKQYCNADYPNLMFAPGDANHIQESSFDIITSLFSLHMVVDKLAAIQTFYQRLNVNGRVLATIPAASPPDDPYSQSIKGNHGCTCLETLFHRISYAFPFCALGKI